MKMLSALSAATLLAACSGDGEAEAPAEADDRLSIDETIDAEPAVEGGPVNASYGDTSWSWRANDGEEMTTTLMAEGAYQMVDANTMRSQGTWSWNEESQQICFDADTGVDVDCWTAPADAPAHGGEFVVTNSEGENAFLTRITYSPARVEAP